MPPPIDDTEPTGSAAAATLVRAGGLAAVALGASSLAAEAAGRGEQSASRACSRPR